MVSSAAGLNFIGRLATQQSHEFSEARRRDQLITIRSLHDAVGLVLHFSLIQSAASAKRIAIRDFIRYNPLTGIFLSRLPELLGLFDQLIVVTGKYFNDLLECDRLRGRKE